MSFWNNFSWTSLSNRVRSLWAREQVAVESLLIAMAPYRTYADAAVREIEIVVKQKLKDAGADQAARYAVLKAYFGEGVVTEDKLRELAVASTKDALLGIGTILLAKYAPGSEWLLRCSVDFAYGIYVAQMNKK